MLLPASSKPIQMVLDLKWPFEMFCVSLDLPCSFVSHSVWLFWFSVTALSTHGLGGCLGSRGNSKGYSNCPRVAYQDLAIFPTFSSFLPGSAKELAHLWQTAWFYSMPISAGPAFPFPIFLPIPGDLGAVCTVPHAVPSSTLPHGMPMVCLSLELLKSGRKAHFFSSSLSLAYSMHSLGTQFIYMLNK